MNLFNKKVYSKKYLILAHKRSIFNENEIRESEFCGCFDCLRAYPNNKVIEWIEDVGIRTAWCPYCHNDSGIGSASGYPVNNPDFLQATHKYWMNG